MNMIIIMPSLLIDKSNAWNRYYSNYFSTNDVKNVTVLKEYSTLISPTMANQPTMNQSSVHQSHHPISPWALALLFIPLVTIFGNSLVIMSVVKNASLKTSINILIAGLAMADLLVALAVMPFAVYVLYNNNHWYLGGILCDVYCAMDVMCSTASIVLLAVISFDRYMAVSRPMYYSRSTHNLVRTGYTLSAVWAMSAAVASPMALGLNAAGRAKHGGENECRFYNADFILYSSIISFAIPLLILVVLYANIFLMIRKRHNQTLARKLHQSIRKLSNSTKKKDSVTNNLKVVASFRSRADTNTTDEDDEDMEHDEETACLNRHKYDNKGVAQYRAVKIGDTLDDDCFHSAEVLPTVVISMDVGGANEEHPNTTSNTMQTRRATALVTSLKHSVFDVNSRKCGDEELHCSSSTYLTESTACTHDFMNNANSDTPDRNEIMQFKSSASAPPTPKHNSRNIVRKKSSFARIQSAVDNMIHHKRYSEAALVASAENGARSSKNDSLLEAVKQRKKVLARERRKQRKATKTLAVVIGVFLICWLPFFTLNFKDAICLKIGNPSCQVGLLPFMITTWIGYMNSFMNPIIYTIFNQEFRAAFIRLLCPHSRRYR